MKSNVALDEDEEGDQCVVESDADVQQMIEWVRMSLSVRLCCLEPLLHLVFKHYIYNVCMQYLAVKARDGKEKILVLHAIDGA